MSLPYRQRSPEAGQSVQAPASDAIDVLVEAVSAGARPSPGSTPDAFDRSARAVVTLPRGARRSWIPSRLARWIAPALMAFALGLGGAIWSLRTFESFEAERDAVDIAPGLSVPAAPTAPPPAPLTPAIPDHLASTALRPSAPFARVLRPQLTATDLITARTPETTLSARETPLAPRPPADTRAAVRAPRRANARADTAVATPAPSSVEESSAANAPAVSTSDSLPLVSTLPAAPATEDRPAVAERTATTMNTAAEEAAVLDTVEEYAQALEQLDVAATAILWPSVDRRALSRAFASLKSQDVMFDDCDVALAETTATARCHGTAHYITKVGPSSPRTGRYEWLFKMRKRDDAWKIEALSAWPVAAAGRDQQH